MVKGCENLPIEVKFSPGRVKTRPYERISNDYLII